MSRYQLMRRKCSALPVREQYTNADLYSYINSLWKFYPQNLENITFTPKIQVTERVSFENLHYGGVIDVRTPRILSVNEESIKRLNYIWIRREIHPEFEDFIHLYKHNLLPEIIGLEGSSNVWIFIMDNGIFDGKIGFHISIVSDDTIQENFIVVDDSESPPPIRFVADMHNTGTQIQFISNQIQVEYQI